jgi:hypothetical protein
VRAPCNATRNAQRVPEFKVSRQVDGQLYPATANGAAEPQTPNSKLDFATKGRGKICRVIPNNPIKIREIGGICGSNFRIWD